ncbi:MAG: hypothetical protein AB7U23_13835 [Dehalococcoidia bacterium]
MDWKILAIEVLRDIADPVAQQAAWIDDTGPRVSEPIELACQLFDDTGLGDRLDAGPVYAPRCDEILRQLGAAFQALRYDQPIDELTASSEWGAIVGLAQRALRCIESGRGGA